MNSFMILIIGALAIAFLAFLWSTKLTSIHPGCFLTRIIIFQTLRILSLEGTSSASRARRDLIGGAYERIT